MCKYCEMTGYHIYRGYFGGMVYAESEHNISETEHENCRIVNMNGNYKIRVAGTYEAFSEPINYCPFCGKKLNNMSSSC